MALALKTGKKAKFTDFERFPYMLTVGDVAVILRISRAGAYNIVNSADFPKKKVGKRTVVQKDDFKQWLNGL
jgi:predicted DNA-binding transcriptional regulator AlpA